MPVSKKELSACPIDAMLSVIDGRWKGTILWRLSDGPMRTGELHRSIPGITQRMLIRHLQEPGARWNPRQAPGEQRTALRPLLHLQLWPHPAARAGRDL